MDGGCGKIDGVEGKVGILLAGIVWQTFYTTANHMMGAYFAISCGVHR